MKRLIIAAIAIVLSYGAMAQTKMSNTQLRDGVMMKAGKMIVIQDGRSRAMNSKVTMSDGTVVMPDGTIKAPDGKTSMLKDGQSMDMTGRVITPPIKKDTVKRQ